MQNLDKSSKHFNDKPADNSEYLNVCLWTISLIRGKGNIIWGARGRDLRVVGV